MIDRGFSTLTARHPDLDTVTVRRAFEVAREAHRQQWRENGEPAFAHPLNVAKILARSRADELTTIAGLLHDTVEDSDLTLEDIRAMFGPRVGELVALLTKPCPGAQPPVMSVPHRWLDKDYGLRALRVKLADRLDNMATVRALSRTRQTKLARESLALLCPVADELDPVTAMVLRRLSKGVLLTSDRSPAA